MERLQLLPNRLSTRIFPATRVGRFNDRFAYFLGLERIFERRAARLTGFEAFEEIGHLVDEAVLVADAAARNPPTVHVRLVAVGDVDGAPAAHDGLVAVVKIFEAVQVVQIPADRRVLAVDLKGIEGFVAAGVARRFKKAQ